MKKTKVLIYNFDEFSLGKKIHLLSGLYLTFELTKIIEIIQFV